jgi:hypothetical protein
MSVCGTGRICELIMVEHPVILTELNKIML